jgi:hypothetical protein
VMSRRFIQENRLANNPAGSGASEALIETERQKDLQTLLTPEERAEFDLRFSITAEQNAPRFSKMRATEQEFRAISGLVERLQREAQALPRDQTGMAVRAGLEQHGIDELVTAIGFDRAVDYAWAGTDIMVRDPATSSFVSFPALPNAARVLQLAAETGAAAAAIHHDATRTPEEKRAALLALQQATQPKLDQLLPPESRAATDQRALGWFNGLAKGEYMTFTPNVLGRGVALIQPISVATPTRGAAPVVSRLRAPK